MTQDPQQLELKESINNWCFYHYFVSLTMFVLLCFLHSIQPINQSTTVLYTYVQFRAHTNSFTVLYSFLHSTAVLDVTPMSLFLFASCYGEHGILPASGWLSYLRVILPSNSIDGLTWWYQFRVASLFLSFILVFSDIPETPLQHHVSNHVCVCCFLFFHRIVVFCFLSYVSVLYST
jgi:hypothetical protein